MTLTYATFPIWCWFETFETFTSVGTFQIVTTSVGTQRWISRAFVDVDAIVTSLHLQIARWTNAHESSYQVLALEFTIVGRRIAFIHI